MEADSLLTPFDRDHTETHTATYGSAPPSSSGGGTKVAYRKNGAANPLIEHDENSDVSSSSSEKASNLM